jgi:hypothetical protein
MINIYLQIIPAFALQNLSKILKFTLFSLKKFKFSLNDIICQYASSIFITRCVKLLTEIVENNSIYKMNLQTIIEIAAVQCVNKKIIAKFAKDLSVNYSDLWASRKIEYGKIIANTVRKDDFHEISLIATEY